MFIAALSVSRTWKQPRCLSADEWIKKLWYTLVHEVMEYYSAIKGKEFELVLVRRMNLQSIRVK